MGSWYNELEYLEKSGRYQHQLKAGVKFRLAFKLRFPFPQVQSLIDEIQFNHSENELSRISYFEPQETPDVKQKGFSQIFMPNLASKITESFQQSQHQISNKVPSNLLILIYFECVYKFLRLRMDLNPSEFIQLLALKLRVDFGLASESREQYIRTNFKAICPTLDPKISEELLESLIDNIIQVYYSIDFKPIEAMQRFIYLAARSPFFFYEKFPLKLKVDKSEIGLVTPYQLPRRCFIALGMNGVYLLDSDFEERKHFTFKDIFKWGYSEKLFILIIDDPDDDLPVKLSFKTRMASNIVYSLNSLCRLKTGELPEENQLQMNRNVTREISQNKFFKRISKFPVRKFHID